MLKSSGKRYQLVVKISCLTLCNLLISMKYFCHFEALFVMMMRRRLWLLLKYEKNHTKCILKKNCTIHSTVYHFWPFYSYSTYSLFYKIQYYNSTFFLMPVKNKTVPNSKTIVSSQHALCPTKSSYPFTYPSSCHSNPLYQILRSKKYTEINLALWKQ